MDRTPLIPRRVLLPTDFTDRSAFADAYAAALVQASGGELILLHVVNTDRDHVGPGPDDPHLGPGRISPAYVFHREGILEEAQRMLAEWPLPETAGITVRREVIEGSNVASRIVEYAESQGVDLIVLSSHGRGLMGLLILGSVAKDLISRSKCPVLCIKRGEHGMIDPGTRRLHIREVAAMIDDSEASDRTLDLATQIASGHRARLHLLYAMPLEIPVAVFAPDGEPMIPIDETSLRMTRERRERFARRIEEQHADEKVVLRAGLEEKEIAHYAGEHKIDVVVMNRVGTVDSIDLLGGAPVRLLHHIHCPLLLV